MKKGIRIQQYIAALAVVLFLAKILAWYLTHSVTVLTDALEGIVNVVAGFLGLFSITVAARPKDSNHPYGHGKAEFLSAAVEGTMIAIAGLLIIYEAIERLIVHQELEQLDLGLLIVAGSGLINFLVGKYAGRQGEKMGSMVLVSAGKHLVTDAYSASAIILGLILLIVTNNRFFWLDSTVALVFAVLIVRTGYKVIRQSVSGIMDETNMPRLLEVIDVLQKNRLSTWVDIHHLRVLEHGGKMHVDAHLTIPRFFKISDADQQIHSIDELLKKHFGSDLEVFIQIEGCNPRQCAACGLANCQVRSHQFELSKPWDLEHIWKEKRHGN
jgi:cation diffusion facilitator family transporter